MELNASQNMFEKSNVLILWLSAFVISIASIAIYLVEKKGGLIKTYMKVAR